MTIGGRLLAVYILFLFFCQRQLLEDSTFVFRSVSYSSNIYRFYGEGSLSKSFSSDFPLIVVEEKQDLFRQEISKAGQEPGKLLSMAFFFQNPPAPQEIRKFETKVSSIIDIGHFSTFYLCTCVSVLLRTGPVSFVLFSDTRMYMLSQTRRVLLTMVQQHLSVVRVFSLFFIF